MRRTIVLVIFVTIVAQTWAQYLEAEEPVGAKVIAKSNGSCVGADVLVSQGWPANGVGEFFYGGGEWIQMTASIDAAASSVTVSADLEDRPDMLQYDALWIDQRDCDACPGPGALTPTEFDNVKFFIATGRRVVMIGENPNWSAWNGQILGLVDGVFGGEVPEWTLDRATLHELTVGVSSVYVTAGGYCAGDDRISLFNWSFATLWKDESVLTLLDVNFMSNEFWNHLNNPEFNNNIAQWIGCKEILFADGFESGDTSAWSVTVG